MFVVDKGVVEQSRNGKVIGMVNMRNFFGEEQVLFGIPGVFSYKTLEPCRIYEIPAEKISDVPIVMWKMLEAHELRDAA